MQLVVVFNPYHNKDKNNKKWLSYTGSKHILQVFSLPCGWYCVCQSDDVEELRDGPSKDSARQNFAEGLGWTNTKLCILEVY